jgi:Protein of unknown function (DUF3732)
MSFQLRHLLLYSHTGERRTIDFQLGALNIVTGASKTGKSSILDIIDYCLGSSDYPVAAGVIRQTVRAFGIVLARDDEDLLVIRFAPKPGAASSTQFYVKTMGATADLPPNSELSPNANLESSTSLVNSFLGISANLTDPGSGTRTALRAGIRHALFFCLQAQDEIASRRVLFHSQAGEFRPQAIRDVIPYFLGVADDQHLANQRRARELKRQIALLARSLEESGVLRGGTQRARSLIAEAISVGLLEEIDEFDDQSAARRLQQALVTEEPSMDLPSASNFQAQTAERQTLRSDYASAQAALANLRLISRERSEFAVEVDDQRSRMSLSTLFVGTDTSSCPVCRSAVESSDSTSTALAARLSQLTAEMTVLSTATPELQQLIVNYEDLLRQLEVQLRDNDLALRASERLDRTLKAFRDAAVTRASVRGRISLYLDSIAEVVADDAVREKLATLQGELETLESLLSEESSSDRYASLLSRVSSGISQIAVTLQLEHSMSPARLDTRSLTVVVDTPQGPIPLTEMGSGENWVGYHLATVLALQRAFREASRPVPRFVALDQPSQVFFPPDVDDPLPQDADRKSLRRILRTVYEEVEQADGDLQVILVDHADLEEDWFQESVVERWRNGQALVPAEWIAPSATGE